MSLSSNPTNENEMSVTSLLFWPIKLAFVVDKWMRVIKEKAKWYASEKVVLFCNSAHCISSWCSWLKFRLSFVSVSSKKLGTRLWWSRPESQLITKVGSSLTSLTLYVGYSIFKQIFFFAYKFSSLTSKYFLWFPMYLIFTKFKKKAKALVRNDEGNFIHANNSTEAR